MGFCQPLFERMLEIFRKFVNKNDNNIIIYSLEMKTNLFFPEIQFLLVGDLAFSELTWDT